MQPIQLQALNHRIHQPPNKLLYPDLDQTSLIARFLRSIFSCRQDQTRSTTSIMAQGYAVFIGLVVIAALCVASWFLAPKGENQVLWRSSAILAIVSCYLMWAITFLAQLHPLIAPRKSGIREEHLH
ncbi:V-type H+-transporting ATPase subunit H [Fusarium odoratissimum NRRL 54006]|nr:V-type H+-transporting ATPase subunit H [Fusarium odoratissimum NRRL 54006]EXM02523.1 V-type H+-transporting ATPase subunit H [Fusarium odoratissimum NRRL 54006]KAH7211870.1 ATP synthase subunit H-domain-containing protein [Fusarium oxysporum]